MPDMFGDFDVLKAQNFSKNVRLISGFFCDG